MQYLLALAFLLIAPAAAVEPRVSVFEYELTARSRDDSAGLFGFGVAYTAFRIQCSSVEQIPGNEPFHSAQVTVASSRDGIDVVAVSESEFLGKPEYPKLKPKWWFSFDIKSLQLRPDGTAALNFRFKDVTEKYMLKYANGEGLTLEPVDAEHGKIVAGRFPNFSNVAETHDGILYQCNSLTISAVKDGKSVWSVDLPKIGRPESLKVLDKTLFVTTKGGQSFYVLRDTGEFLFFHGSVMAGGNPADDIRSIWQKELGMTFREREKRGYRRFINAAVKLEDKNSIPLLIATIDNGQGLEEKCAAIAALEKFNGNKNAWPEPLPRDPSYFMRTIGMRRAYPDENRKSEIEKWKKIFKDDLEK